MRIDGSWFVCDDGILRPVIRGRVLAADGSKKPVPFLVDTGADCTVFSAAILADLGLTGTGAVGHLGGVGGLASSILVDTEIYLPRDGGEAVFRGRFAAFTAIESLDM